jgi:hypothetical protein
MMKKLLPFAAMSALALVTACDNGGSAVDCTADADCADEEVNTQCDISEGDETGVCVAPSEEQCEDDADCDISDTGSGSNQFGKDELDAGNDDCEDEDFVTVVAFDGTEICALGSDGDPCVDSEAVQADAPGGGEVEICVVARNTCDEEAQCVAN